MSLRLHFASLPHVSSQTLRAGGVYLSGALYGLAFYSMLDSALWSAHHDQGDRPVHVGFVDWIPLLLSSLGMTVINLVEKSRLQSGMAFGSEYGTGNDSWQAKVVLFMGFAFLSGGLAGSVLILTLRYIIHGHWAPQILMGFENVASAGCVMLSCVSLWVAQNLEDDYSYSLQL